MAVMQSRSFSFSATVRPRPAPAVRRGDYSMVIGLHRAVDRTDLRLDRRLTSDFVAKRAGARLNPVRPIVAGPSGGWAITGCLSRERRPDRHPEFPCFVMPGSGVARLTRQFGNERGVS